MNNIFLFSFRFYRGDQDSEEELVLGSDDEYESDVPQDSLGNNHNFLIFFNIKN